MISSSTTPASHGPELTPYSSSSARDATMVVEPRPEPTILELLLPVARKWRSIATVTIAGSVLMAIVSLMLPKSYTAQTSFTAEVAGGATTGSLGSLAQLAGQLGVGGLGLESAPELFAAVLSSRVILEETLQHEFAESAAGATASNSHTLLDLLDVEGDTPERRLARGVRALKDRVRARVDKRSGIITLAVDMPRDWLAADVANFMVRRLNAFNLERRQSQSAALRAFAGRERQAAADALRQAEDRHAGFLASNRRFEDSPLLRFEEDRLRREVQLRQDVYLLLSRKHEDAKLAEVQDTPVLGLIDNAVTPDRKSAPRRVRLVSLTAVSLLLLSVFVGFVDEVLRATNPGYAGGLRGLSQLPQRHT